MQRSMMRLRTRGASGRVASHQQPEEENPAADTSRAVLGDVSNRRQKGSNTSEGGTKESKAVTKESKDSTTVRRSKVKGADSTITQSRRVSTRSSNRKISTRNARTSKTSTSIGKRGTKSRGGDSEQRETKRRRAETTLESEEEDDQIDDASADQREDIQPRNLDKEFIVNPDYRIQRRSFNGIDHTSEIAPHDIHNKDDVLEVTEYVTDIFQYLYHVEAKSWPRGYMEKQQDINAKMRAILVDWLVEVHMKFRLNPETLYLCINIIDRYCNLVNIARSKLQLVGVTALLIACKYEEIYPPEVRDCVYITDRAYQRQEVLDMEQDILNRLRFKITVPTPYPFLQRFLTLTKASQLTRFAAQYYTERTLQEYDVLKFRPSLVCAAAVILALNNPAIAIKEGIRNYECPGLDNILLEYTGFAEADILECAAVIARKVGEEPVTASRRQLVAVKRKYDNKKYMNVSIEVEQPDVHDIVGAGGV